MAGRAPRAARSWRDHWDEIVKVPNDRAGATARRLRLRRGRLPGRYLAGMLAAVATLVAVPYGEELWRCARAAKP